MTPEPPHLLPGDLRRAQATALKAICSHPAFRIRSGAYRARGAPQRILPTTAGYLLDMHLVERRLASNGTPYLVATERGRALVQSPSMPDVRRMARPFSEPAETPILDADVFDDPFSGA